MDYEIIFFIGPQGSGKGTQAKLLAHKLGYYYWEMGQILRNFAEQDSALGQKVKALLSAGVLFPDDFLLELVKTKLGDLPQSGGIIFDGIPRRLGQAEFLLNHLQHLGRTRLATIFIDLPKNISLERLLARAEKEGRADDTREVIEYRLQQYEKDTLPVLNFLKQHSVFITIDGSPPIAVVTQQINYALKLEAS